MATLSAVITGGTKGIGLALVQRFAAAGFQVLTCARSLAGFEAIQAQYPNGQIKALATDMSKPEEVAAFAAFVLAEVGSPSVLINNTGVFLPGTILGEPAGNLELMINTNVYSAYHLSRALVPAMLTAGSGHIFNICSTASLVAYPNGGSYCISKLPSPAVGMGLICQKTALCLPPMLLS
jgi:NAD(P)-dependent dehydrogenase (short-subunit alcohol dehydrogenase family)